MPVASPRPPLKKTRRRELVQHYVRLHGTVSPTEIRNLIRKYEGYGVARETVRDDIEAMAAQTEQWNSGQAMQGWNEKIRQWFLDANLEIDQIRGLISSLIEGPPEMPPGMLDALADIEDGEKIAKYVAGLQRQVQLVRAAGKVGYLNSILDEKRGFIIDMMSDQPLYLKTQELARRLEGGQ